MTKNMKKKCRHRCIWCRRYSFSLGVFSILCPPFCGAFGMHFYMVQTRSTDLSFRILFICSVLIYLWYLSLFRFCCFFVCCFFFFLFVPPFFLRHLPGIFVRSLETILGYFWQVIIFFLEQVQISEANSRAKFYYHLCRGKLDISYVYGVVLKLTIEIFYLRCVNTNIRCH